MIASEMTQITRRRFGAGLALAVPSVMRALPLGLPIGCQTYPVRQKLGTDLDGTLKELASMGFKHIEMCSPPGYERSGYGPLLSLKASELRDRIRAAGMGCDSCHYQFRELKQSLDERIAYAKELGLKQMVVSTFSMPRDSKLADWARAAGEMNPIAEKIHKAGLVAAFHNHNVEFTQLEGVLIYDKMMSEFDPKLVKMQYQTIVATLGIDAVEVFKKYPGRIVSLHLQDYVAGDKKMTAIGQGVIDWKKLFGAAKKAGVKNYYVEMSPELMQASVPFLRDLKA